MREVMNSDKKMKTNGCEWFMDLIVDRILPEALDILFDKSQTFYQ
jgi:hypothetical protein